MARPDGLFAADRGESLAEAARDQTRKAAFVQRGSMLTLAQRMVTALSNTDTPCIGHDHSESTKRRIEMKRGIEPKSLDPSFISIWRARTDSNRHHLVRPSIYPADYGAWGGIVAADRPD